MNSSEVLKEMKLLRQEYHKQNFQFTKDQKKKYNELLKLRHDRVNQMRNGVTT